MLSNKGGRGKKNREEIGAGATEKVGKNQTSENRGETIQGFHSREKAEIKTGTF